MIFKNVWKFTGNLQRQAVQDWSAGGWGEWVYHPPVDDQQTHAQEHGQIHLYHQWNPNWIISWCWR